MLEDSGFAGSFGAETQFVGQNKSYRCTYCLLFKEATHLW